MHTRIQWAMVTMLTLVSPVIYALGLGGASVDSYLNQPLDVRVELISQSSAELQSITAGLAAADDFELLGLSRSTILVPLEFEIVTDFGRPHIRITSRAVINEPVVQILVEVVWANGRMLREYTLFLDPPTFAAAAPPVAVRPPPRPAVVEKPLVKDKPAVVEPAPQAPESILQEPEPIAQEPERAIEEPETDSSQSPTADEDMTDQAVYGPVASGETLWGIARDWSQGTGYSINQTMLALQRKNPDAFIRENINSLKRGAILRLPAYSEIDELSSRDAMLEVLRQEEEARTGIRTVAPEYSTPTVADSGDYQQSVSETLPEPEIEEDTGHLELVPPAEKDDAASQVAAQVQDQETVDESMQQELARTEEELANAQQENIYLKDRIEELEAQQQEKILALADSGLAGVESALAEKRAEDETEQPVALTPGGEEQPWYAGGTVWIVGTALLLLAFVIWILRRRDAGQVEAGRAEEKNEAVKAVTDETEDLLRILDRYEESSADSVESKATTEPQPQSEPEPEPEPGPEPEPAAVQAGETEEGGAETEDPEVKLDLARAYLSLGDKEAAKSMLDEVLSSGNEAQQAEARQMMEEL